MSWITRVAGDVADEPLKVMILGIFGTILFSGVAIGAAVLSGRMIAIYMMIPLVFLGLYMSVAGYLEWRAERPPPRRR